MVEKKSRVALTPRGTRMEKGHSWKERTEIGQSVVSTVVMETPEYDTVAEHEIALNAASDAAADTRCALQNVAMCTRALNARP